MRWLQPGVTIQNKHSEEILPLWPALCWARSVVASGHLPPKVDLFESFSHLFIVHMWSHSSFRMLVLRKSYDELFWGTNNFWIEFQLRKLTRWSLDAVVLSNTLFRESIEAEPFVNCRSMSDHFLNRLTGASNTQPLNAFSTASLNATTRLFQAES